MNRATDDLISRSVLIDELMAGGMPLDLPGLSGVTGDELTIRDYIDSAPAVDAVPVVRCKDCWKRGLDNCPMEFYWDSHPADDVCYCAMGERREDTSWQQ